MSNPIVVQALKDKRAEIHGRINAYQVQIAEAKHDLTHLNAAIRLFTDVDRQRARHLLSHGFFRKGEIADICVVHGEVDRELTTKDLAERVMYVRNHDLSSKTLRDSVMFKVVQALRHAARRRFVTMVEKRKGMFFCAAGEKVTLRVADNPSTCSWRAQAGHWPATCCLAGPVAV